MLLLLQVVVGRHDLSGDCGQRWARWGIRVLGKLHRLQLRRGDDLQGARDGGGYLGLV